MRSVVVWMVGMLACAVPVWAAPPSDVLGYAVFGIVRVSIGARSRVAGDVGVLFETLDVGRRTQVAGAAAAPSITLHQRASASPLFCGTLTGSSATCEPLPNPLIGGPTIVLATPGNLDVSAAPGSRTTAPLAAGAYGRLNVGAAARVTLVGGSYQFEAIDVANRGHVLCLAACNLTVRGGVRLGRAARLGADDGVAASDVLVRIAAQGQANALETQRRATILGSIYGPSGEVTIGAAARITGAVVGNVVSIGPRARLAHPAAGA